MLMEKREFIYKHWSDSAYSSELRASRGHCVEEKTKVIIKINHADACLSDIF